MTQPDKLSYFQEFAIEQLKTLGLSTWCFKYDNAERRGGQCDYTKRTISLSKKLVEFVQDFEEIKKIIYHELAHALCPGEHHNAVWKRKCIELGGSGERCHKFHFTPKSWLAKCPCGYRKKYIRFGKRKCKRCKGPMIMTKIDVDVSKK